VLALALLLLLLLGQAWSDASHSLPRVRHNTLTCRQTTCTAPGQTRCTAQIPLLYRMATVLDEKDPHADKRSRYLWKPQVRVACRVVCVCVCVCVCVLCVCVLRWWWWHTWPVARFAMWWHPVLHALPTVLRQGPPARQQ
jgi:hypothetical protein